MKDYTYIAADFDHDKDAVDYLNWMNKNGYLNFKNAHEIQQSYDSSLSCSIKKSLKYRMDFSYKFILIVGRHTNTVTKGGCQFCGSYNPYSQICARHYSIDYRSFIKFECDKALEEKIKIVVLYNNVSVDRNLCPEAIRWYGIHKAMCYYGYDGKYHWDNNSIIAAIG